MIELRFLGELNLGVPTGAARRQLTRPRSVAVLSILASAEGDGVTRDRLVALLWESTVRERARHSLANQIHLLRKALGSEAIATAGEYVRFDPGRVTSDIREFRRARANGDLSRAAELYRGPFLDGFHLDGADEYERWVDRERQALATAALETFEMLAARAEADADVTSGLRWRRRALRHDPWNSRLAVALARALATSGDPGNGVQILSEHARRLEEDLGIPPDPGILAMIETGDFGVKTPGPPTLAKPRKASADSAKAPGPDVEPGRRTIRSGRIRGSRWGRAIAATLATLGLVAAVGSVLDRVQAARGDTEGRVAVLPVRLVGVDSSLAALVAARLHSELAHPGNLHVVPQAEAEAAWQTIAGSPDGALTSNALRTFGSRTRAAKVLESRVTPSERGIEVGASLVAVPGGAILAEARAAGPIDSLGRVVDVLVVRLAAAEAGIPTDRIATLSAFEPEAVHRYIQSHPRESDARYRLLREAIARDSTFALAALELYEGYEGSFNTSAVADPTAKPTLAAWDTVASMVWSNLDRLSPADRAYATARLGWRYAEAHTARLEVAAWEDAVEAGPDRLFHWQGLFNACYSLCSSYTSSWRRPLLAVHDSLLARGDSSRIEEALEVATMAGDSARLRAYSEVLPPDALYARWVAALGLGDEEERAAVMDRLPELSRGWLMRLGNFAILSGLGLDDAERAAKVVPSDRRPGSVYALRQAVLARERGRHVEYRRLRDRMFQLFDVNAHLAALAAANVVAEWAGFGEPETEATLDEADRALSTVIRRNSAASPDTLEVAHCYRSWLRIERGDTSAVRASARFLETEPSVRRRALARMCAPFLKYLLEREGDRIAHQKAASRLYDAVRDQPVTFGQLAGTSYTALYISSAAKLALARSFGELGYPETGFQLLGRRPIATASWGLFGFHIDFVREEARLLAQAGETDAALDRYEKYFRFRPEPPDLASWAVEWEIVREEYEALRRRADA
jgi:DNA-binding SARP family transcriptional activator